MFHFNLHVLRSFGMLCLFSSYVPCNGCHCVRRKVLQHGNTQWLHGAMLMTTYLLIAIISWFIPEEAIPSCALKGVVKTARDPTPSLTRYGM